MTMKRLTTEEKKRADELFKLVLQKSNMTYQEFLFLVKHNFVASNLDVLSKEEKEKFNIEVPEYAE